MYIAESSTEIQVYTLIKFVSLYHFYTHPFNRYRFYLAWKMFFFLPKSYRQNESGICNTIQHGIQKMRNYRAYQSLFLYRTSRCKNTQRTEFLHSKVSTNLNAEALSDTTPIIGSTRESETFFSLSLSFCLSNEKIMTKNQC